MNFFQIDSNGLSWFVDNDRNDWAIGESQVHQETRVILSVDKDQSKTLEELFREYTDEFEFNWHVVNKEKSAMVYVVD